MRELYNKIRDLEATVDISEEERNLRLESLKLDFNIYYIAGDRLVRIFGPRSVLTNLVNTLHSMGRIPAPFSQEAANRGEYSQAIREYHKEALIGLLNKIPNALSRETNTLHPWNEAYATEIADAVLRHLRTDRAGIRPIVLESPVPDMAELYRQALLLRVFNELSTLQYPLGPFYRESVMPEPPIPGSILSNTADAPLKICLYKELALVLQRVANTDPNLSDGAKDVLKQYVNEVIDATDKAYSAAFPKLEAEFEKSQGLGRGILRDSMTLAYEGLGDKAKLLQSELIRIGQNIGSLIFQNTEEPNVRAAFGGNNMQQVIPPHPRGVANLPIDPFMVIGLCCIASEIGFTIGNHIVAAQQQQHRDATNFATQMPIPTPTLPLTNQNVHLGPFYG